MISEDNIERVRWEYIRRTTTGKGTLLREVEHYATARRGKMLRPRLLLAAAAPSAINSVLAARINRLNVDFTIASFLMTTAIFLLILFPAFFLYVTHGGRF